MNNIISGDIPAWVYDDMADEKAHSLLLLDNEQSELSALEKGKHAYDHIQLVGKGKGGTDSEGEGIEEGLRFYAREHHVPKSSVDDWYKAYKVYKQVSECGHLTPDSVVILREISKTAEEAWGALCECAVKEEWTVRQTKR